MSENPGLVLTQTMLKPRAQRRTQQEERRVRAMLAQSVELDSTRQQATAGAGEGAKAPVAEQATVSDSGPTTQPQSRFGFTTFCLLESSNKLIKSINKH